MERNTQKTGTLYSHEQQWNIRLLNFKMKRQIKY
jgi:hypothetical protein